MDYLRLSPQSISITLVYNNRLTRSFISMREVPISIQRAMLRQQALATLFSIPLLLGLMGAVPWGTLVIVASLVGAGYVGFGTKLARRLNALRKSKFIKTSYSSSVESVVSTVLFLGIVFVALAGAGLKWLTGWPGSIEVLFYAIAAGLGLLVSVWFYLAQLPAVLSNQAVRVRFFAQ